MHLVRKRLDTACEVSVIGIFNAIEDISQGKQYPLMGQFIQMNTKQRTFQKYTELITAALLQVTRSQKHIITT